ncbi:hypothetical protein BKA64DRAFT_106803 [Cadophora sp. MPI-SDFR-AT-0126]|nr:hypothetical protein BKA64DRAFT_106803 [Leotiomycetes sp. MPI-SDFR-AT-0126]
MEIIRLVLYSLPFLSARVSASAACMHANIECWGVVGQETYREVAGGKTFSSRKPAEDEGRKIDGARVLQGHATHATVNSPMIRASRYKSGLFPFQFSAPEVEHTKGTIT